MGVRLVTLDVFGTLFDWRGKCREFVSSRLRLGGGELEAFLDLFRSKQLQYMVIDTLLRKARTNFLDLSKMAFLTTARSFNLRIGQETFTDFVELWSRLDPFEDVPGTLRELKSRGYTLAMLSNGDRRVLEELAKRLPGLIDDIISSEDAGVYKPDPEIYLYATRRYGLAPEDVTHIAGSYIDVIGAASVGLRTFWVNRTGAVADEYGPRPDKVFYSFNEVLNAL